MPKQQKPGKPGSDAPADPGTGGTDHAVPPMDRPLLRHEADSDGSGDAVEAALRVEAIRRTRMMPSDTDPPAKK